MPKTVGSNVLFELKNPNYVVTLLCNLCNGTGWVWVWEVDRLTIGKMFIVTNALDCREPFPWPLAPTYCNCQLDSGSRSSSPSLTYSDITIPEDKVIGETFCLQKTFLLSPTSMHILTHCVFICMLMEG